MARIKDIRIYPVKGLDPTRVETGRTTRSGTLAGDREYAMLEPGVESTGGDFDTVGGTLNGKDIEHLHEIESSFDPETGVLALEDSDRSARFELPTESDAASEWLSEFVGFDVALRHRDPPGFVDRPQFGPSVISTGTLEEVASWFDGMTVESARARLRPNVEVGGVPAFWEDQFLGEEPSGFDAGGVRFEGIEACVRCVVPSRDPDTGEPIEAFRRRFVERRRETLPPWVDEETLGSSFSVMLITSVPETHHDETLRVGEEVSVEENPKS